ncbi:MAG: D-alanyl-D-alanine carboxypeptidase family protein [Candidatus Peribacteria bacterium]|jgi:D-alanyl-D-alanine carboxypeptidase|nr:D-alanyl-D-alanine carboxypeptidase family protein [Candidatus Peribacteria bacterium]
MKHRKGSILLVTVMFTTLVFSLIDYLFASQQGMLWEYNPITDNWEKIGTIPLEEVILEGRVSSYDLISDASVQKFLDDTHPFGDEEYIPDDITPIISHFTFNDASKFSLRSEAALQFADMAWAFSNAFGFKSKLSITSAYRSPSFQKRLAASCSTSRCALPGTSEHEAGLALDIGVNGGNILAGAGKYYLWLQQNAHEYGFHNTYQKGIEIDGKMKEPRHRRYVGVELATYLHDQDTTLAEYFYSVYPKL